MIVPSSNTCLEPTTYRMLGERTDVSVHFTRIQVARVGLDDISDSQFDTAGMETAAVLFGHRRCRRDRLERHCGVVAGRRT